jgi:DNA-binding NtrC family response regulator
VDVRIIAATNRDLRAEVDAGRFREDLFYRINVITIALPALRDRPTDIPRLIDHFLLPGWKVDAEARARLTGYAWPGNVRQLINVLERAMILADDLTVTIDDLPPEICAGPNGERRPAAVPSDTQKLDDLQRAHIVSVLERERGNKARAARTLGIHRRKLYRLIERYGISAAHE